MISIGGRPSCSDVVAFKTNQTLTNIRSMDLTMCSVNDVPGTYSYFSVCSSVSCIPLDFCLQADLWVFKTFMVKQFIMLTTVSLTPICNRDYGNGCLACEIYWKHISGKDIFYFNLIQISFIRTSSLQKLINKLCFFARWENDK